MQWARPADMSGVEPISDADAACLAELRGVLAKHGVLERFGVALFHSFPTVGEDELMMETTDEDHREHWVRPISKSRFEADGVTAQSTVISFDENGFNQACGCDPRASGHHHK